jgi:hypothetical protein
MSMTPNLLLPRILAGQAQKPVTHNEALRSLDGLVQLSVKDRTRNALPASPVDGACYIVGAAPTGAWAGWARDIALRADGAWHRLAARGGFLAWVEAEGVLLVREGAESGCRSSAGPWSSSRAWRRGSGRGWRRATRW